MMQPDHAQNHTRRRACWWAAGLLLALVSCQQVDAAAKVSHNALVLFNSGSGRGNPNIEADTAALAAFLRPQHATRAPSMAGRGGEPSGCRFLGAGFPHPATCLPPQPWKVGGGSNPTKEATMSKFAHSSDRAAVTANIELYDTANLACEFLDQIELLLGFLSKCDDARQRETLHVLAQNTVDNYGPLMAAARDKAADRLPS